MQPQARAPRVTQVASILILVQVYRVIGVVFLFLLAQGRVRAEFGLPAAIGDILVGATAPFVAYSVRRGRLRAWGAALVWNALGIADLAVAVGEGVLTAVPEVVAGATPTILTLPYLLIPTVAVPTAIILHIVTLLLLTRPDVRTYVAAQELNIRQSQRPATLTPPHPT